MDILGFLAKKIISTLIYPLGLCLGLIFGGLILRRLATRSRLGFFLVLLGSISLTVLSFPITGYVLLRPLELEAGPYAEPAMLRERGVRYIVVLGAEWVIPEMTPADRLGDSIFRVIEGVRLWKGCPESRLILSGGSMPGRASDIEALPALLVEMGVPRKAIIMNNKAWDTTDEARIFGKMVQDEPFALVTAARHIPRAVDLFKNLGLNPIPCPCQFETMRIPPKYQWFLPGVGGLRMSTWAIHERVGGLWSRLKQRLR